VHLLVVVLINMQIWGTTLRSKPKYLGKICSSVTVLSQISQSALPRCKFVD